MEIVPFEEKYRDDVEAICIATASEKARTSKVHHDFTLWMYCDAYLDDGICYVLLQEGKPVGYVMSVVSYAQWRKAMLPYAEKIAELPEPYPTRLRMELEEYGKYDAYPSHMHIDILESYTGNGNGSKLLQTLFARLRKEGVPGVMLGVAAQNKRAIAFYQKNGFEILEGGEGGFTMGVRLD